MATTSSPEPHPVIYSSILSSSSTGILATHAPYSFNQSTSSAYNVTVSALSHHDLYHNEKNGDGYIGGHTIAQVVVISIFAVLLMVMTVVGNLLVIISYNTNRQLRTINNMFLVSLACSDLVIGVVSMTLYPIVMIGRRWLFGSVLCDIWLCIDYTLSMASVANLMLICLDRYFSVTRPFTYRAKRTRPRARMIIAMAWVFSFLLWSPAIVVWPRVHGRSVGIDDCYIQFLDEDQTLTLITAVLAFFLPVLVMSVLYGRIYQQTKKCSQYLEYLKGFRKQRSSLPASPFLHFRFSAGHRASTPCDSPRSRIGSFASQLNETRRRFLSLGQSDAEEPRSRLGSSTSNKFRTGNGSASPSILRHSPKPIVIDENAMTEYNDVASRDSHLSPVRAQKRRFKPFPDKSGENGVGSPTHETFAKTNDSGNHPSCRLVNGKEGLHSELSSLVPNDPAAGQNGNSHSRRCQFDANRNDDEPRAPIKLPSSEKKAGRTLFAILFAFAITWLPYNICAVYKSFCTDHHHCVPIVAWDAAYYFCYINSTINPFCFALCNKTFRKTFRRLLACRSCRKEQFGSRRSHQRPTITKPSMLLTRPESSTSST